MTVFSKAASFSERSRHSNSSSKDAFSSETGKGGNALNRRTPGAEYVRSRALGVRPSQFIRRSRGQELPYVETAVVSTAAVVLNAPGEPHSEPQESPVNAGTKRRSKKLVYMLVAVTAAILIVAALSVTFGIKGKNSGNNDSTTKFENFTTDCNALKGQAQPHAFSQCYCNGNISIIAADVAVRYSTLMQSFIHEVYPTFNDSINSCSPHNQALVWLASGDGYTDPSTDESQLRQRYSLAVVFSLWNGLAWKRSDEWLSSISECSWFGIVCNNFEIVDTMALSNNSLVGELSPAVPLLTSLISLMVDGNDFRGIGIPTNLGNMSNLQYLELNSTGINGTIPSELFNLSGNLQYFNVAGNDLTGTIPALVEKLTNLSKFLL
jgi:hypothetical protein